MKKVIVFLLRPHDPIEFLAYYLLTKNPYTQNKQNKPENSQNLENNIEINEEKQI